MAIRDSRGARPKLLLQLFNLKRSWEVLYLVKSPSWGFWSDKSSQNSIPSHANPWVGRTGLQGRNNPPTPFRSTYTYNADQLCWVLELDTEPQTSKWSNLRVLQVEDRFWQIRWKSMGLWPKILKEKARQHKEQTAWKSIRNWPRLADESSLLWNPYK